MIRRAFVVASMAIGAIACGSRFVPPTGAGTPIDATEAWTAATSACRSVTSHVAALRVSGRAGTRRVARLFIESAVTRDQIYLNARVGSQPVFVLAGSTAQATLWLRGDDQRVVRAPAPEIIEAILGLAVSPDRLLGLFSGCVTRNFEVTSAASYGGRIAVQTPDARVFLHQPSAGWQVLAGETEGFIVALEWRGTSLPTKLSLDSQPNREPHASLNVTIEEPRTNESVAASFFAPPAGAANAQPMTIDELRSSFAWRKND